MVPVLTEELVKQIKEGAAITANRRYAGALEQIRDYPKSALGTVFESYVRMKEIAEEALRET